MFDRLLILDLNGTLCHVERITKNNSNQHIAADKKVHLPRYNIYKRPHLRKFLLYEFKQFHIAVWTTREKRNMHEVIDNLFTPEQKSKLVFTWARDKCEILEDHSSIKDIDFVLRSQVMVKYCFKDILIIDDTYDKIRNPDHYYIIPTYKFDRTSSMTGSITGSIIGERKDPDRELTTVLNWLKTYDDSNEEKDLIYAMDYLRV